MTIVDPKQRRQSNRVKTWYVGLGFVGLAVLFYAPIVAGLRSFPDGDFAHHFLPFSLFQQQELLSGRLPVWNPYTYSGHPFLADVQAAVFYPLSNLLLALSLPWTDAAVRLYFLEVEAILHVALAGFFTYLLASELTDRRWAGVLAGICFALSGYLTGYPPVQLAVLRTATWLPLLLWLFLRAAAEPGRWRWWIGAGLVTAVAFLAGHSQTFLYIVYTTAAWLLLLTVARWGSLASRQRWYYIFGLLGSGLLATGLSAVQLLPSAEFAGLSVRANVDYDYVSGGFPLQDTWQLLLPGVLTQYSPLYIGVVGLGLAWFGGLVALRGLPRAAEARERWSLPLRAGAGFFLAVAVVALLLSYGSNGFLYPVFYRLAPGWNLFRGQERAACLVALGLSVLAGFGALAVTTLSARTRGFWATVYAGVAIAATYLFGLLWQLPGRTAVDRPHFLLWAALTVTLVSVFALLLRAPGWSRRRWLWLAALAAVNLFLAGSATNVSDFSPARKTILAPEVEAVQRAVAETSGAGTALPGRVYNEFRSYEDYGMRIGVEDVWGASPLRLARYAALFDQFPLDRMWALLGVEHVLTWRKELFGPTTLLAEFPQTTDTTYLHRLPEPHPRAWLAQAVRQVSDDEAIQLLADHQFDLNTVALVPAGATAVEPSAGPQVQPHSGTVQVERIAPAHLRVTVADSPGGLLALSENWMPGWRVQNVECKAGCSPGGDAGTPVGLPAFEPLRADLTLIGVPLPKGTYTFDLIYQPDSIRNGLWITGAALILLAVAVSWQALSSRRSAR